MLALSLPLTFALLGMVVDVGWAYWRKEACHTAAQAAASAAITAANASGTLTVQTTSTGCPAGLNATVPLQDGCLYAKQNGFVNGGKQTVSYTAGITGPPVAGFGATTSYWVTFRATEQLPLTFLSILGQAFTTVASSSTGVIFGTGSGCVIALQPSGTAIQMSGTVGIQTDCGVYTNSNSPDSISMSGSGIIDTGAGGAKTTIATGGWYRATGISTISPAPVNASRITDPFATMQEPDLTTGCVDSVSPVVLTGTQSRTIGPGRYCQGITMSGSGSLTFMGGLYQFEDDIRISGSGTITSSGGVTLYQKAGGIDISGSAAITLNAPTSGSYQGVLIFQSRGNTSGITLSGTPQTRYTGAVYAPAATLSMSGGAYTDTTIVCSNITMSGNGGVTTIAGSAISSYTGQTVSLIQ